MYFQVDFGLAARPIFGNVRGAALADARVCPDLVHDNIHHPIRNSLLEENSYSMQILCSSRGCDSRNLRNHQLQGFAQAVDQLLKLQKFAPVANLSRPYNAGLYMTNVICTRTR